jgi:glucokinase
MRSLLAGDVGGTNARLAYFEAPDPDEGGGLRLIRERTFASGAYPGLVEIVAELRAGDPRPVDAAAFGVAGPVVAGRAETPNLPWCVDASELAACLHLEGVELLNDLAASAYGLSHLGPEDVALLHPGKANAKGHLAVVAAGTGLGQAGLFWDGVRHRPFASEGGHCDFAPRDELEVELWRFLSRSLPGHVSAERVLSGRGLVAIFEFLQSRGGAPGEAVARALEAEDPAAVISRHGLDRTDALCDAALERFASLYGGVAGNVALQFFATGGVYVGGGIAPRILPRLKEGGFVKAFLDKGRMRHVLEEIPVRVILNDKAALWGAAQVAAFRR